MFVKNTNTNKMYHIFIFLSLVLYLIISSGDTIQNRHDYIAKADIGWISIVIAFISIVISFITYLDNRRKSKISQKNNLMKLIKEARDEMGEEKGLIGIRKARSSEEIRKLEMAGRKLQDALALVDFGKVLNEQQIFDQAEFNLLRAVQLETENSYAYFILGKNYYDMKKINDSIKAYRKGLRHKSNYLEACVDLETFALDGELSDAKIFQNISEKLELDEINKPLKIALISEIIEVYKKAIEKPKSTGDFILFGGPKLMLHVAEELKRQLYTEVNDVDYSINLDFSAISEYKKKYKEDYEKKPKFPPVSRDLGQIRAAR